MRRITIDLDGNPERGEREVDPAPTAGQDDRVLEGQTGQARPLDEVEEERLESAAGHVLPTATPVEDLSEYADPGPAASGNALVEGTNGPNRDDPASDEVVDPSAGH